MKALCLFAVFCAIAGAQIPQPIPGQDPTPLPGTYPPGQTGPGIPMPKHKKKTDGSDPKNAANAAAAAKTYSGVIREVTDKSFDIETTDTRILTIQLTDTTEKPGELKVGQGVDVEATQDDNGLFQAVKIKLNPEVVKTIIQNYGAGAQEEGRTAPPPTILVRPGPTHDADDSGPPKIKRGRPVARASKPKDDEDDDAPSPAPSTARPPEPAKSVAPAPAAPAINPRQAFVEKARTVAASYVEGLPNYICQEFATRYVSQTRNPSWNAIDVVSAEVVYENHQESYRNLQINGKATKKKPEETGAWSTGEFGTILSNLFNPGTDADFEYKEDDTIEHRSSSVYRFDVERARSHWKIWLPGQYILPAYKGSIWVDKENANVLRIEMQAQDIPEDFPLISVESAIDYDYISLGTPEKFLLPIRAEVLECARDSNMCERNTIEFRNYHKFTGESIIKYDK